MWYDRNVVSLKTVHGLIFADSPLILPCHTDLSLNFDGWRLTQVMKKVKKAATPKKLKAPKVKTPKTAAGSAKKLVKKTTTKVFK